jgi:hypothetical protein
VIRKAVAGAVGMVVLALAGGCAAGSDDVASLTGGAGGEGQAVDQTQAAQEYYDCLTDIGIAAVMEPWDSGEINVRLSDEGHMFMVSAPGWQQAGGDVSLAEQDAWQSAHEGVYGLMWDGEDRDAEFEECYTSTGYIAPGFEYDAEQEFRTEQVFANVTNTWIACARAHGLPNLPDVAATREEYDWPEVELPGEMTPDTLRDLFDACPQATEETVRQTEELHSAQILAAQIVFTGLAEALDADLNAEGERAQRLNELQTIYSETVGEVWGRYTAPAPQDRGRGRAS